MSVSSISSLNPATYQSSPTSSVTSGSASSPVVPSNDPGLAQQVSALSTTAAVVATLGSSSSSNTLTYDAAGLYNSIAQAGPSTTTTAAATTPASSNTGTTSAAATTPTTTTASTAGNSGSGYYTGNGVLQSDAASGTNLTANWASALKENPTLSSTVSADSLAQGIIGTLSVTA
jgi:hypothetical protein